MISPQNGESQGLRFGPLEERSLFNSAFVALMLYRCCKGWSTERQDGMHVILSYLVVPIALHTPTRIELPRRKNAVMLEWIQNNPSCMSYIPMNASALKPKVSSGIEMAIRSGAIRSTGGGLVRVGSVKRLPRNQTFTEDVNSCLTAAQFLGRWFAQQSDVASVLAAWGIRP